MQFFVILRTIKPDRLYYYYRILGIIIIIIIVPGPIKNSADQTKLNNLP